MSPEEQVKKYLRAQELGIDISRIPEDMTMEEYEYRRENFFKNPYADTKENKEFLGYEHDAWTKNQEKNKKNKSIEGNDIDTKRNAEAPKPTSPAGKEANYSTQDLVRDQMADSVETPTVSKIERVTNSAKKTAKEVKGKIEDFIAPTIPSQADNGFTTGDLSKAQIEGKGQNLVRKAWQASDNLGPDSPATPLQAKLLKVAPKALIGATLFIAGTSLLDSAMKRKDAYELAVQKKQGEDKLEKQRKQEEENRKNYRTGASITGPVDTGQLVFDLFNERTGHHKMGNSRF